MAAASAGTATRITYYLMMKKESGTPLFFATPAKWRAWLKANHASKDEVWMGLYKRASGKPSITWPEAVDEALAFGWIDGVRKRIDDESYKNRFTPRRQGSNWSLINLKRVAELTKQGRMHPAGLKVHAERDRKREGVYSFEQDLRKVAVLPPAYRKLLTAAGAAGHYDAQAPWYRRVIAFWILSAKKEETQLRRLQLLIDSSAKGKRVPGLEKTTKS